MENPKSHLISRILKLRKKLRNKVGPLPYIPISSKSKEDNECDSFKIGTEFESFVVKRFNPDFFTLVEWRSDKSVEGIFPIMSRFPDLEFHYESQSTCLQFAVECKWREYFYREGILLDKFQLENYRHYEDVTGNPTFLVIGVGNVPSHPRNVYVLPLKDIKQENLHEFELDVYRRMQPHDNFFIDTQRGRLL